MALNFPVVGVGASAGGLFALQSLFGALPGRTGLAFVVVQHLSPTYPSQLARMLQSTTRLAVREALDGALVERDHVYVIAPGQTLTIAERVLRSAPSQDRDVKVIVSVDTFFDSLASEQHEHAVGVVLSGTGSDGAAGAVQIKLAGGVVFAQEPATAAYEGMPRATIATGAAHRVMPIAGLAEALGQYAANGAPPAADGFWKEHTQRALDKVSELVREHAGADLDYEATPLLWRIQRRLNLRGIDSLPEYALFLEHNVSELDALIRGIPILFLGADEALELSRRGSKAQRSYREPDTRSLAAKSPALVQLSIDELEESREELHAANYELTGVNDGLNIVNARLAGTNDQLNTANERLHGKSEELEAQRGVLGSGAVMTLFLDQQLCVRWFTPAMRQLYPLMPTDIGRPLADLAPRFNDPRLLEDVQHALEGGRARENEVKSRDGNWYERGIRAHARTATQPAGVIVTFDDVNARRNAAAELREHQLREERFRSLMQALTLATWETNASGVVVDDSPSWRAYTGQTLAEWLGHGWLDALHPEDRAAAEQRWRGAVDSGQPIDADVRLRSAAGDYTWTNVRAVPLRGSDGAVERWVCMNIDISRRMQANESAR